MKNPPRLSLLQALIKAQKYCAYQERCHQEVRNKLCESGLQSVDIENIITQLIEEDFLNEQRFTEAFVRGKFRIKKWGRNKIIAELNKRKISNYCQKKGLAEIDETEYLNTLKEVIAKREKLEKETNKVLRNKKIAQYLYARGFESELIWEMLKHS